MHVENNNSPKPSESSYDNNRDGLPFKFRLSRKYVLNYMDSDEPNTDDDMCFKGTIDLKTGRVISARIGRQQNVA